MDKVIIVFEEFRYNGVEEQTLVYPCATEDIARRVIKERYEWYIQNSYFKNFIGENGEVDRNELDDYDCWCVDTNDVELFIDAKNTALKLYFTKENLIKE